MAETAKNDGKWHRVISVAQKRRRRGVNRRNGISRGSAWQLKRRQPAYQAAAIISQADEKWWAKTLSAE
jgi:hypothetical protein